MKTPSRNLICRNTCFAVATTISLLAVPQSSMAQSIFVPNHSFESQSASGFPFDTNPFLDSWQKIAEPAYYQFLGSGTPPWYGTAGAFVNVSQYNPTPYGNVAGAQAVAEADRAGGSGRGDRLACQRRRGNQRR